MTIPDAPIDSSTTPSSYNADYTASSGHVSVISSTHDDMQLGTVAETNPSVASPCGVSDFENQRNKGSPFGNNIGQSTSSPSIPEQYQPDSSSGPDDSKAGSTVTNSSQFPAPPPFTSASRNNRTGYLICGSLAATLTIVVCVCCIIPLIFVLIFLKRTYDEVNSEDDFMPSVAVQFDDDFAKMANMDDVY